MGKRLSWMGIGLLAVGSILASPFVGIVAASSGYLVKTGPSPLRFREPAPAGTLLSLGPLPMADRATTNGAAPMKPFELALVADAPGASNVLAAPPVSVPPNSLSGPLGEPDGVLSPPPMQFPDGSTNVPVALTPQMLVSFFKSAVAGTNGMPGMFLLPVEFTPPAPLAPPASRATYNVR